VPKGEPSNFLTEMELKTKFFGLTNSVLGPDRASALAASVLAIDTTADISALMRHATPLTAARMAGE
jgi:hypothetical protein